MRRWTESRLSDEKKKQTKGCPAQNRTDRDADPDARFARLLYIRRRELLYETVSVCCLFAVHRTFHGRLQIPIQVFLGSTSPSQSIAQAVNSQYSTLILYASVTDTFNTTRGL
jgi:hypothetical protein